MLRGVAACRGKAAGPCKVIIRRSPIDVAWMVQQFLTLEARYGNPLDVEWALANRVLYVLQARPIVVGRGKGAG